MMLVVAKGAIEDEQQPAMIQHNEMDQINRIGSNSNGNGINKLMDEQHIGEVSGDEGIAVSSNTTRSISGVSSSARSAPSSNHKRQTVVRGSEPRRSRTSKSPSREILGRKEEEEVRHRHKSNPSRTKSGLSSRKSSTETPASADDNAPDIISSETDTRAKSSSRRSRWSGKLSSSADHQLDKTTHSHRSTNSHKASTSSSNGRGSSTTTTESKQRRQKLASNLLSASSGDATAKKSEEKTTATESGDGGNSSKRTEKNAALTDAATSEVTSDKIDATRSKRQRSKSRSKVDGNVDKKDDSTLDSATHRTTAFNKDDTLGTLRSSVKVASALSKFRMVLAKSKQATTIGEKYQTENNINKIKESVRNGETGASSSSRDKRAPGSNHSRRQKGSRHRREAGTDMQRKSSSSRDSDGSMESEGNKKNETPDDMLMKALTSVGRKLAKEKAERQGRSASEDPGEDSKSKKETVSARRLKSSAKVSTAMLKFQQALALSKSATMAARTQQDTQNKVLGAVHSGGRPGKEDYRVTLQKQQEAKRAAIAKGVTPAVAAATVVAAAAAARVSPISVDMVESPTQDRESPKLLTHLVAQSRDSNGDEDDSISEESEVIDVSMSGSEVDLDSEDEMDSDIDSEFGMEFDNASATARTYLQSDPERKIMIPPPSVVSPEVIAGKTNMEGDNDDHSDLSISDHSSVDLESDDELDSDEEVNVTDNVNDAKLGIASDGECSIASKTNVKQKRNEPEVEQIEPETPSANAKNDTKALLTTPQHSVWNGDTIAAQRNSSGSQNEGESPPEFGGTAVISKRLQLVRSLSFQMSNSALQASPLDKSLSDWRPSSSRDLTSSPDWKLVIPGLSPKEICQDSQPSLSYLPVNVKSVDSLPDTLYRSHSKSGGVSEEILLAEPPTEKPDDGASNLTRKQSNSSLRKRKDASSRSSSGNRKQVPQDGSSNRTSSRKPSNRDQTDDAQSNRSSKHSSSTSNRAKIREERISSTSKRSSSTARAKTLAGVAAFSEESLHRSKERSRNNGNSASRRKTPNRTKSRDDRARSSRDRPSSSSAGHGEEGPEKETRRSRREPSMAN